MPWKNSKLEWTEIHWSRPFEADNALSLLTQLATIDRFSPIVFEVRARRGRIHYLLGAEPGLMKRIKQVMNGELAGIRFSGKVVRSDVHLASSIKLSHPQLALNTNNQSAVTRATLASLAQTKLEGEETVSQVVLGQSLTPTLLPNKLDDPSASWLDIVRGSIAPASADARSLMRERTAQHGFMVSIRIGSHVTDKDGKPNIPKTSNHIRDVFSSLKVAQSAGVRLKATQDKPNNLNQAKCPWLYPMKLSVKELLGLLALPFGEEEFAGVAGLHPKLLLPPTWYKGEVMRSFGLASGFKDGRLPLGVSAKDSLEHSILLGPTGSGKSTVLLNLILADIRAGRSVLVIDPKSDLVNDVLSRMPLSRIDDVVVIDPTCANPVGFNPIADSSRNASLVTDSILATLREIFADSWGIRTQDVLSASLLTLIRYGKEHGGVSLVLLPALLTDASFRKRIVSKVASSDPLGLGAFWAGFEAMSVAERNQVIAPVMNKLRQFLLRPQLRHVLGQTKPKFSLNELFTERKIVLVSLNKGTVGAESARLLGSLIVGQLWTLALGRAAVSPEKRHIVNVFIDEVQDYLSLPTDLSDALSQARGLGVGLTLAHQYRAQLPPTLRAGIDANARNKIVFGLNGTDARDMASQAEGKLEALDFTLLPRYGVYANLQSGGKSTGWISGSTLPAPPATAEPTQVKSKSQARYGQDAETVEHELLELIGHVKARGSAGVQDYRSEVGRVAIGRKPKDTSPGDRTENKAKPKSKERNHE